MDRHSADVAQHWLPVIVSDHQNPVTENDYKLLDFQVISHSLSDKRVNATSDRVPYAISGRIRLLINKFESLMEWVVFLHSCGLVTQLTVKNRHNVKLRKSVAGESHSAQVSCRFSRMLVLFRTRSVRSRMAVLSIDMHVFPSIIYCHCPCRALC